MISTIEKLMARRGVSPGHREQVVSHLRHFLHQTGDRDYTAFRDDAVNDWLDHLVAANGRSPKTLRAYRASVINAWRTAMMAGLVDTPPGFIRPIRAPRKPPVALTIGELRTMVTACDSIVGGQWARALILLTWDTGLRPCDAYDVEARNIGADGVWRLVQRKTGVPHAVRVRRHAKEAIARLGGRIPVYSRSGASSIFRRLRRASGVPRGTARWLRRSAASYVEAERPGDGRAFLGHKVESVAERHYFDPAITGKVVEGPAALLVE